MGTPTLASIRSAVVLAIQTGMNSGTPSAVVTVHPYRRFWRDTAKFQSLFRRSNTDLVGWRGLLNGWTFNVMAREEEFPEWFRFATKFRVELEGYLAVKDTDANTPSPKTQVDFADQVEAVRDQIRMNTSIFSNTEATSPVSQVEEFDAVTIAGYTCWHCKLTLEAESINTVFS